MKNLEYQSKFLECRELSQPRPASNLFLKPGSTIPSTTIKDEDFFSIAVAGCLARQIHC